MVQAHGRAHRVTGQALYAYAEAQARALGWTLNLGIKGHRVGDFLHAIHKAGKLADLADTPSGGLWILEIQIAHPARPNMRP